MSQYKNKYIATDVNTSWSIAEQYIEGGSTVLEIGASNGNFSAAMIENKSVTAHVVEPDKGDAQRASKKIQVVINDTLENALVSLKKHTYDHIVFLDVIEHFADPVKALKDVKKLLKKGGSIIFSVPNMAHMSVRLMLLSGTFTYAKTGLLDTTHLHFYTHEELARVFTEAGYQIEDLNGVVEVIEDRVIYNELKKIGIPTSRAFIRTLKGNNGTIYQFVGKATVASGDTPVVIPECSPDINELRKDYYQVENQRLWDQLAEKDKIINDLRNS
ncbi:MAG: methyltransferase domain-containing protein [Candidatus Microsaccharimonas sp.]